jgi:hypothetical protein
MESESTIPVPDRIAELESRHAKLITKRSQMDQEIGELAADIIALKRVCERGLLQAGDVAADGSGRAEHGALRAGVLEALNTVPDEFTITDVMVRLTAATGFGAEVDQASVSSCLRRLAQDGEKITEIKKGQGRRKTKYGRKDAAAA